MWRRTCSSILKISCSEKFRKLHKWRRTFLVWRPIVLLKRNSCSGVSCEFQFQFQTLARATFSEKNQKSHWYYIQKESCSYFLSISYVTLYVMKGHQDQEIHSLKDHFGNTRRYRAKGHPISMMMGWAWIYLEPSRTPAMELFCEDN